MASTPQQKFIAGIKSTISQAADKHRLTGSYPYDSLWVHPPDPTMARNTVNVGDHHLRSVFVWVPELTHPRGLPDGRPPCPRCKTTRDVVVKGWTQKLTRRAVLRDSCCDLLVYFYHCRNCAENNKGKPKASSLKLALLFDLIPKQLIARPAASTSASYRPLLFTCTPSLLCLSSIELQDAGCGVLPRMGCRGAIAASVVRPGLLPFFLDKKVPFTAT